MYLASVYEKLRNRGQDLSHLIVVPNTLRLDALALLCTQADKGTTNLQELKKADFLNFFLSWKRMNSS